VFVRSISAEPDFLLQPGPFPNLFSFSDPRLLEQQYHVVL
jgi:hypothetical protein